MCLTMVGLDYSILLFLLRPEAQIKVIFFILDLPNVYNYSISGPGGPKLLALDRQMDGWTDTLLYVYRYNLS